MKRMQTCAHRLLSPVFEACVTVPDFPLQRNWNDSYEVGLLRIGAY